jgi:hypothetical protein
MTLRDIMFAPAPVSNMQLLRYLLFIIRVMKKGGFSPYWILKWSACSIIGGSIGSAVPEKKLLKRSLIEGILIASFKGTFTCIFDKVPSKSKSRVILSASNVLEEEPQEIVAD